MKVRDWKRSIVLLWIGGLAVPTLCGVGAHAGPLYDYNGDGKSDLALYCEAGGKWYIETTGRVSVAYGVALGGPGYTPVAGDFNGDGRSDLAVYCQSEGSWTLKSSMLASNEVHYFGWPGAVPVPADYDGDGKTDRAVYSRTSGNWNISKSSDGSLLTLKFGWDGLLPVPADYDGDGIADLAAYDPSNGMWYVFKSTDHQIRSQQFGWSNAQPVPGDFDGDGKDDFSVYDPEGGTWYVLSRSGRMHSVQIGWADTLPAPADYDGDGMTDLAVYYPNQGQWYIVTTEGTPIAYPVIWGWDGALPIPVFPDINRPPPTASVSFWNSDTNLIVALGDSITYGFNLPHYSNTFVASLASLLHKTVVNEGVSGEPSRLGLARSASVLSWYKPGTLIILFGANDIQYAYDIGETVSNLRDIIQTARINNTVPLICTLTPVADEHRDMAPAVRALNREIRLLAQTENVTLVDFESALGWNSAYLLSDGLHPNSAGHQAMANTLYNLLK